MKNLMLLKAVILCMVMMVCGLSLTACGDDDEPEVSLTNERETIKATYSVSLSDDWYKYFDIEVRYTVAGAIESETLDMDWKMNISIPASAEPDKYVFSVIAKPKANAPELDPEVETYEMSVNVFANVSAVKQDGSVDESYGFYKSDSEDHTFNATAMAEYIKEEQVIFSFEEKVEE